VLRKGNVADKQAILYEVVAEDTSEEGTSARRRGTEKRNEPQRGEEREDKREKLGNLQVVYGGGKKGRTPKAAEELEVSYLGKQGNVTNGFTESSSKRRGDNSQETED
jgi:superfamily II DNA or RNA helicase